MFDLVKKILLLPMIFALIIYIINYFVNKVKANLNLEFFDLIYYFGVIQAVQVLISFAIVAFIANHMLTYFKNL